MLSREQKQLVNKALESLKNPDAELALKLCDNVLPGGLRYKPSNNNYEILLVLKSLKTAYLVLSSEVELTTTLTKANFLKDATFTKDILSYWQKLSLLPDQQKAINKAIESLDQIGLSVAWQYLFFDGKTYQLYKTALTSYLWLDPLDRLGDIGRYYYLWQIKERKLV